MTERNRIFRECIKSTGESIEKLGVLQDQVARAESFSSLAGAVYDMCGAMQDGLAFLRAAANELNAIAQYVERKDGFPAEN